MDRVGLGRALGFGARQAARTLMQVADAATTPSAQAPAARTTATVNRTSVPRPAVPNPRRDSAPVFGPQTVRGAASGAKGLGKAVWNPMARFTSVLWLEVTGFFYGMIALMLGSWAWRQAKASFGAAATGNRNHFYLFAALTAMFAYFAVSNFVKARRRERR